MVKRAGEEKTGDNGGKGWGGVKIMERAGKE